MSNPKQYTGTTRTLNVGNTAYRDIIFLPNKPPLDAELNFISDIAANSVLFANQANNNSGFFNTRGIKTVGFDPTGNTFCINATNTPNTVILRNPQGQPFTVQVLGEQLQLGASFNSDASKVVLALPPAGGSTRDDLVFLEVWYQQLISQSGANEPAPGTVYPYGNTQYGGSLVVNDDMFYSPIGIPTTNRVQLQYGIRIVSSVNFVNHPDGVDDSATVFGQAGAGGPTSFAYTRHATDTGCYVAGDGNPTNALGSIDGYVYAIPLMRVHRRNASGFSLTNQSGAGKSLMFPPSDRPDGLYYDQIAVSDIEDLRHVLTTESEEQLLEQAMNGLLEGNLNTFLMNGQVSGTAFNGVGLEVDGFTASPQAGVAPILSPNGQRRCISDASTTQATVQQVLIANKTVGNPVGNWTAADAFQITNLGSNPSGTQFGVRVPSVYATVQSGATQSKVLVPSSASYVGNVLVVTLGTIPSGVTNQGLWVDFDLQYPPGFGLNYVPIQMEQVYNTNGNLQFSFCSEQALNGMRTSSLVTSASANDVLIGRSPKESFTTLGYYSTLGTNTTLVSVPATLGGVGINFVHSVYVGGVLFTRAVSGNYIVAITRNFDNSFTVQFANPVSSATTIVFSVGLFSHGVATQEATKSVVEMATSQLVSKAVGPGANGGSGLTSVTIETPGYIYGTQSEVTGPVSFQDVCFVNSVQVPCTLTFSGNYVTVSNINGINTAVGGGGSADTVQVVVTYALTLSVSDNLQMYYTYRPYNGVTARLSFGNGGSSQITSKVVAKAPGFLVHTSGTNGVNTSVPAQYAPILPKLPKPASNKDSDLSNGTLGAVSYPKDKGLDISSDSTLGFLLNATYLDAARNWSSNNADTTAPVVDTIRKMFDSYGVRFDKTGTSTALATITKTPVNTTNWSSIMDVNGNILGGKELGFWYYIPNNSTVATVSLILHCTGSTNHVFQVTNTPMNSPNLPIVTAGWNKALFTARTSGSAANYAVTSVEFQVNYNSSSVVAYGHELLPPYLENANTTVPMFDGDVWFSQSRGDLVRFSALNGTQDFGAFNYSWYHANAYAFGIPVVAGTTSPTSTKNLPYGLGKTNLLNNTGNNNTRGTPTGSNFYNVGLDSIQSTNKQAVAFLLEQVISDPTGNFAPGEYMLRVETRIVGGNGAFISNADFDTNNSVDVFRLQGRPLGKL